jgi:phage shock protein E
MIISFVGELGVKIQVIICAGTLMLGMLFSSISYADPVWIGVSRFLENKIDNIEGDIRISHSDLVEDVSRIYPDKNTNLHLYCCSGTRAGKALSSLKHAGYNNLQNVGSIGDARKVRATTH